MTPTTLTPAAADLRTELPVGLTVEDAVRIAAALDASHAESTRTLHAHTWRVWQRWCPTRGSTRCPATRLRWPPSWSNGPQAAPPWSR